MGAGTPRADKTVRAVYFADPAMIRKVSSLNTI